MASHTSVDWGPHGMWLSNCSDDINSIVCDYVTQVAWKVTNTTMEQYRDKGLLGWLDGVEWHLLVLGLSSINKLGRTTGHMETWCEHQRAWNLDQTFHRNQS